MTKYYVVAEDTENTLISTDNLKDAVDFVINLPGDGTEQWINIICDGYVVKQFILNTDGTIIEELVNKN